VGRWRVLTGGVVIALVGLGLSGCAAPIRGITGVRLVDGAPTAFFHPCPGSAVVDVRVSQTIPVTEQYASGAVGPGWDVHDPTGTHPVSEVRLLGLAPTGWNGRSAGSGSLSSFADNQTYVVNASTTQGDSVVLPVSFTLADLRDLTSDQVWAAPTKPYGNERAMSLAAFADDAASSC
jgi:hypothetical protein